MTMTDRAPARNAVTNAVRADRVAACTTSGTSRSTQTWQTSSRPRHRWASIATAIRLAVPRSATRPRSARGAVVVCGLDMALLVRRGRVVTQRADSRTARTAPAPNHPSEPRTDANGDARPQPNGQKRCLGAGKSVERAARDVDDLAGDEASLLGQEDRD